MMPTNRENQVTPKDQPLDPYRAKRDFEKTAEPSGGGAQPRPDRPRYLIQKHDATQLHYDLRLEVDSVLKSWAVPKGPSLDPGEKRLAVMTEDHPLEYATFEGTIPEGEYGGGTVMMWDRGWWEVDREWVEDSKTSSKVREAHDQGPATALEAGELKFKLHGQKLKGSWVLVQMKGRGDKNWLLIKHRDQEAREDYDITEEQPDSVTSGRDLDEIEWDAESDEAK